MPCPAGTYNPDLEQKSVGNCDPSPVNHYQDLIGQQAYDPTKLCQAGFECPAGSTHPRALLCVAGTKCPAPADENTPVPVACDNAATGEYQDENGATVCKNCPAGFRCTQDTVERCEPQNVGQSFYCPANQREYVMCDPGYYTFQDAPSTVDACVSCPPGYYCEQFDECGLFDNAACATGADPGPGTKGTKIQECPEGKYCPEGTSSTTDPCPAGNVCAIDCPAGFYCPTGSAVPLPCPVGSYCTGGQGSADGLCDAGYSCQLTQLTAVTDIPLSRCMNQDPTQCWIGSSVPNPAGYECPEGSYCPRGTYLPIECPIGTYLNQANNDANAASGYKFPGQEKGDCFPCDAGQYCFERGATAPG